MCGQGTDRFIDTGHLARMQACSVQENCADWARRQAQCSSQGPRQGADFACIRLRTATTAAPLPNGFWSLSIFEIAHVCSSQLLAVEGAENCW